MTTTMNTTENDKNKTINNERGGVNKAVDAAVMATVTKRTPTVTAKTSSNHRGPSLPMPMPPLPSILLTMIVGVGPKPKFQGRRLQKTTTIEGRRRRTKQWS